MKGKKRKLLLEDSFFDKFNSPIPPHLSPEEKIEWGKELKWEQQELERRKKEGFWKYSNPSSSYHQHLDDEDMS